MKITALAVTTVVAVLGIVAASDYQSVPRALADAIAEPADAEQCVLACWCPCCCDAAGAVSKT
ncbi:hypothetical protein PC116_g22009 [Phytophthora cactorum]|uniref:Uncharacterized protein n=2 Tax=Phytophthora TaxID=4783 RepID=A0A329RPJ4_9STRA|nr:hypothetical protein Pcac1_g4244 [Phytophthora cactorum]KAG6944112.1 hypothetical protein JG688_00017261 [Phytophthora aleatoria]KAG2886949.1 hypothetical protein PC114_g19013 [Phytophthora cactorum]KAG2911253.1 hypothetical protein PC117_g19212 [Phytophthora cactorum]KAG2981996.1 hypothetical protein PC119_g20907 [Phytophthora cactorum]